VSALRGVALVIALGVCLSPAVARAGGFATARFGGEFGTVAYALPTAIYYNPAGIGLLDGQHLMIDGAFALRTAEYRRDPAAIDASTLELVEQAGLDRDAAIDALSGTAELSNWNLLPFVGAVTDLGMKESPIRLGAALFVPFGGQSRWEEQSADPAFPGASDGPARWYTIEGTIRAFAVALAVAYRLEAERLSFGLSGNLYFAEVHTVRARNANATDNLISAAGTLIEGRSLLDVSGKAFGLGAGVMWEPIEEVLWLGASYQSQPGFGELELEGTLANTLGTADPEAPVDVVFTEELPDIVRLGGRVRPHKDVELRLELRWERWSQLEQMCLADAAVGDVSAACASRRDGSLVNAQYAGSVVQIFQRDWRDTFAARAGGSYFVGSALELFAGAGFENSAIPDRTLEPALFDMNKLSFALGAAYRVDNLTLWLTLTDVIYFEHDTRGVAGNESLLSPSRQPSNQGVFTQNTFIIQPAAALSF
jgi:long-chain fatty acid transport protein